MPVKIGKKKPAPVKEPEVALRNFEVSFGDPEGSITMELTVRAKDKQDALKVTRAMLSWQQSDLKDEKGEFAHIGRWPDSHLVNIKVRFQPSKVHITDVKEVRG